MAKRELIEPKPSDKRYVRRDEKGQFSEERVDVGKSLARDRSKHARSMKRRTGREDHGDRRPSAK